MAGGVKKRGVVWLGNTENQETKRNRHTGAASLQKGFREGGNRTTLGKHIKNREFGAGKENGETAKHSKARANRDKRVNNLNPPSNFALFLLLEPPKIPPEE